MSLINSVRLAVALPLAQIGELPGAQEGPGGGTPPPDLVGDPRDLDQLRDAFADFFEAAQRRLPYVLAGLVVLVAFIFLGRVVRGWVERIIERTSTESHVQLLVAKLAFGVAVAIGALVALAVIGLNLAVLVGSLGLATVAVGFAMQDVLGNFVAGIALLLERPFTRGDFVVMDGAQGVVQGTVEDIRVRATRLRTPDGRLVMVPNKLLFSTVVTNASATRERRLEVIVNIPYHEDSAQTRRLLLDATKAVDGVLDHPEPQLVTQDFGQGALQVLVWFWVNPQTVDILRVRSQVLEVIDRTLREADVDLAVPTLMATMPVEEPAERSDDDDRDRDGPASGSGAGPDEAPGVERRSPAGQDRARVRD